MKEFKKCVYCNKSNADGVELNTSDIIPQALSYARITISNVCKIEHNKVFGDTFESNISSRLERLRSHLCITGKDGIRVSYIPKLKIGDYSVISKMYSFTNCLIKGEILVSRGGKKSKIVFPHFRGSRDEESIDFSSLQGCDIKEDIGAYIYDLVETLKSKDMQRLAAKVCFEWYCKKHYVNGKPDSASKVINFICDETAINNGIVSILNARASEKEVFLSTVKKGIMLFDSLYEREVQGKE